MCEFAVLGQLVGLREQKRHEHYRENGTENFIVVMLLGIMMVASVMISRHSPGWWFQQICDVCKQLNLHVWHIPACNVCAYARLNLNRHQTA